MIRPFTLLCLLLACGSGLYLYQQKHRGLLLDHEIEATVHATDAARERMGVLQAEWMLLNDPERLRGLADRFLRLRTTAPGQFTTFADLDQKLPAVAPPAPPAPPDAPAEPVPVAEAAKSAPTADTPKTVAEAKPAPTRLATAPTTKTADAKPEHAAKLAVATIHPQSALGMARIAQAPLPIATPIAMVGAPRPTYAPAHTPPPAPIPAPVVTVAPVMTGSALGMARAPVAGR